MREFGSIKDVVRNFKEGVRDGEVKVPCGTCNACCRSIQYPELTLVESVKYGDAVVWTSSFPTLKKRVDNSCIKLIDGKCSIYDDRPKICKLYDCRMSMITSRVNDPAMIEAMAEWTLPTRDKT